MFTDENLKELKTTMEGSLECCKLDIISPVVIMPTHLQDLIERLEAAEACAWYAGDDEPGYLRNPLWSAWRKAAGK